MAEAGGAAATVQVTVVACLAPRTTREWALQLPAGATVRDALAACGAEMAACCEAMMKPAPDAGGAAVAAAEPALGIWGRAAAPGALLKQHDRVEVYRPLTVDPKVARRERFARQGARATGLFARQRPGGKAGY